MRGFCAARAGLWPSTEGRPSVEVAVEAAMGRPEDVALESEVEVDVNAGLREPKAAGAEAAAWGGTTSGRLPVSLLEPPERSLSVVGAVVWSSAPGTGPAPAKLCRLPAQPKRQAGTHIA